MSSFSKELGAITKELSDLRELSEIELAMLAQHYRAKLETVYAILNAKTPGAPTQCPDAK